MEVADLEEGHGPRHIFMQKKSPYRLENTFRSRVPLLSTGLYKRPPPLPLLSADLNPLVSATLRIIAVTIQYIRKRVSTSYIT